MSFSKPVTLSLTNALGTPTATFSTIAYWGPAQTLVSVEFDSPANPIPFTYALSGGVLDPLPSTTTASRSTSASNTPSKLPPSIPIPIATPTASTSASTASGITSASSSTSSPSTTATSSTSSTSSTSTPPKPTKSVNREAGVSNGAAAGIGIGCAVIGALLAALGVWILMRKKRHPRRSYSAPVERSLPYEGGGLGKGSSGGSPPIPLQSLPASTVERMLPQPLDDNTIGRDFSKLGTALKNHAQTYYVSEKDSLARADTTAIQRLLGPESSLDSGTVADMLARAHSRLSATRYLLAWAVIQRIDDDLLPPGVATCMQSMAGLAHDPNGE
ncbi:MAG: hypothetical protein M1821_008486 [Bathelium mastoideum]|nr:MAG: hypothetical protein M1821_008486 [Bathelium mastoideum]